MGLEELVEVVRSGTKWYDRMINVSETESPYRGLKEGWEFYKECQLCVGRGCSFSGK